MASPIETMLRNAFVAAAEHNRIYIYDYSQTGTAPVAVNPLGRWEVDTVDVDPKEFGIGDPSAAPNPWSLYAQVLIESYRADFAIDTRWGLVTVECDGHDWHERTKQQAAYDRSRDRELLRLGIPTVRFTGSEITHSAERCASDLFAICKHEMRRSINVLDAYHDGFDQGRKTMCQEVSKDVSALARLLPGEEHW